MRIEATPLEHAAREIVNAIQDEGIAPNYHRQQLRRLKREWPTLYYALRHIERVTPPAEPVTVFDPDYIYTDRDGDEWEHLRGRWISGDTHAKRVDEREITPGRAVPPADFGPYTRIEKESQNE